MEMGCKIHPESTKLGAKIQQVGPRIRQNRFQEASWRDPGGLLGPAWPEDRPKSQKVARRTPDGPPTDPLGPLILEAQIVQNPF